MKSHTFTASSADDFLNKARLNTAFLPTLAIIFSSPEIGISHLVTAAASLGIPVFGSSTAGEILPGEGLPSFTEQTVVCCMLDIDPQHFRLERFSVGQETSFDFGCRIGEWGKSGFAHPAFLITVSGFTLDGEAIIRGMETRIPPGTTIIGGLAGDDGNFEETSVFSNTGVTTNGTIVMALDLDRFNVWGTTSSGWQGVGAEMVVTSSEGNIIRAINGRPPVDIVKEYLNIGNEDLIPVAVSFPLHVRRADGTEVLRTALSADFLTGALTYAGSVPEGSRVRFSSSFGPETIDNTVRDLEAYHRAHPHADLAVIFSCFARHRATGDKVSHEILAVKNLWKSPSIGFFTYGEIGESSSGRCDVHNETLSIALIEEKH